MGLFKAYDTHFVTVDGLTKTEGGGGNLANGQVGVVNLSKGATKDGAIIVGDFDSLSKKDKLQLRMGKPKVGVTRSLNNKPYTSPFSFTLDEILDVRVDAPKMQGQKVDDFIIGFDGTNGTEIDLDNGTNLAIQLSLSGNALGRLGYKDSCTTVQVQLEAPNTGEKATTATPNPGEWTVQEIVERAVTEFSNYKLLGDTPLTDLVEIIPVNSENAALVSNTQFYTLSVPNSEGTFADLGKVQAQYPNLTVVETEVSADFVTYTTVAPSAPSAYTESGYSVLKGCKDCPSGYTELTDGFVYQVVLDGPTDQTALVQAIPGAEAGSAILNATNDGQAYYSVVTDDALTEAEIETFLAANAGSSVEKVSEDVVDFCQNPATTSTAWVEGESCTTTTETYEIRLSDDDCGTNKLADLQAKYADLTITAGPSSLCQTTYTTTVTTSVVCEECSDEFRALFVSEAPSDYGYASWTKAAKEYNGIAKMGIRFRGKNTILSASEDILDDISPIYDSVRLSLVGGYPININESYDFGVEEGRLPVKLLSRFEPAQNLGMNLRCFEEAGRVWFNGTTKHTGNNYAKHVFGDETRFDGTRQYVDYVITTQTKRTQGGVQQQVNQKIDNHIWVPVGKHQDTEELVNAIATAASLSPVKAFATT